MEEKPRILIVEDDFDLAEMLNLYFQSQNYEVLTAAWGQEALAISAQEPLNLIMLDIRLPDIDGYEVCRQLRLQRRTQHLPIIFLTEKRDRVDKLQGLELGVVDYITKPFDIQEVRLRVRNAIARAARQQMTNPVTDLPEGALATDHLAGLLGIDQPWSAVLVSVGGLSAFREVYGFLAADDVLRAVTLMVRNAVREFGSEDDFIGQLGAEDFVLVAAPDKAPHIRERIEGRFQQSRAYFYPDKDLEGKAPEPLWLRSSVVEGAQAFATVDDLKHALYAALSA